MEKVENSWKTGTKPAKASIQLKWDITDLYCQNYLLFSVLLAALAFCVSNAGVSTNCCNIFFYKWILQYKNNFFFTSNNLVFYWSSKIFRFVYLSEFYLFGCSGLHNQDEQGDISGRSLQTVHISIFSALE